MTALDFPYRDRARESRVNRRRALPLAWGLFLALAFGGAMAAEAGNDCQRRADTPKAELLRLVRHDCGSCHGLTLKGGLGKPLLPKNLAGRDARTLARIILDGIPGTPMPAWRGILTERDALWIARKLKEGLGRASP